MIPKDAFTAINISLWISLVIAVVFVIKTNYPTSKARSMKEIIDKPDFIKIENFCSVKQVRRDIADWEEIIANEVTDKGPSSTY